MNLSMTGQEKGWPFHKGDCLIEVTRWAGVTVYIDGIQNFSSYRETRIS